MYEAGGCFLFGAGGCAGPRSKRWWWCPWSWPCISHYVPIYTAYRIPIFFYCLLPLCAGTLFAHLFCSPSSVRVPGIFFYSSTSIASVCFAIHCRRASLNCAAHHTHGQACTVIRPSRLPAVQLSASWPPGGRLLAPLSPTSPPLHLAGGQSTPRYGLRPYSNAGLCKAGNST